MARTNPNDDWPDHQSERYGAGGSEWEGLRNELVALLDQVEDQVLSGRPVPPAPRYQPEPPASLTRHHEALRSVRQAVDRMTERAEPEAMPRRDAIAEAVNQIRARQAGQAMPPPTPAPAPKASPIAAAPVRSADDDVPAVAKSVAALGQRIEAFEAKIASRFDTLDKHGDIAGQVSQLSEVIELLAGAVGETGQVRRLEAQISQLSEAVKEGGGATTLKQLEDLTATIEKLTAHQVHVAGRDEQFAADASAQQAATMQLIEEIVLNIYNRLDALEHARPAAMPELERISTEMAALSAAVSQNNDFPVLLERIDTLGAGIGRLESRQDDGTEALKQSISTLRSVVLEALEPRLSSIEATISGLGENTPQPAVDVSGIEGQLRQLAKKLDDTNSDIIALSESRDVQPVRAEPADLTPLADLIVERTRAMAMPSAAIDAIEKTDLDAFEERLTKRIESQKPTSQPPLALDGVKESIAQVDSRLARLEAMLNEQPDRARQSLIDETILSQAAVAMEVPAEAPATKPAQAPRRSMRPDVMPSDPVSGTAPKTLETAVLDHLEAETSDTVTPSFRLDPETVDRPAKPQSSFAGGEAPQFEARWSAPASETTATTGSNVSRASFIEAARRSARQQASSADETESKSLIGRAMSRFQKTEEDLSSDKAPPAAEPTSPGREHAKVSPRKFFARPEAPADADPVVDPFVAASDEPETRPGFIARNRRALLLGAALAVVVIAGATLMLGRGGPARSVTPAAAVVVEQPPAVEVEVEDTPVERTSALTSAVRMIDQPADLSAGVPDTSMMLDGMPVDPVQTAALAPQPDRYIDRNGASSLSATLPAITVPEGIGPDLLRVAAEGGDRFAQFEVGAILTEGHVVEQDFAQAAAWYERSAVQGFTPAQYRLGNLYESGRGVERDLVQARLWYQRAAESGNRMSMHNLASLYAGGELETQDFAAAAHWFEEAAARGLTDSQFNLGMLYARGLGVEQDLEKSYVWFSLAGRSGDEDAVTSRDDIARSLDAEAVLRLNEVIAAWTPTEIDLAANFAPIGTWDDTFDPGQVIANREVVERVQTLLGKLGFDVGQPDGMVGPRTRDAITAFERATGMTEVGQINPRLLAVLGSQPV